MATEGSNGSDYRLQQWSRRSNRQDARGARVLWAQHRGPCSPGRSRSGPSTRGHRSLFQGSLHEVAKLNSRELIAFDTGTQDTTAIDDRGASGVRQKTLVGEGVHPEQGTDSLEVGRGACEEVPDVRIGLPLARVFGQSLGLVANWIERNG